MPLDAEDWTGCRPWLRPAYQVEWRDLLAALRRAVDTELTPRQREVFVAIVLTMPAGYTGTWSASSRNAIYKMCSTLGVSCGRSSATGTTQMTFEALMNGWSALDGPSD